MKLKEYTKQLPVRLTIEEKLKKGEELASNVQDISNEEARQKNIKDQMKDKLSELEFKVKVASGILHSGEEYRDVLVEMTIGDKNVIQVTRTDTGEIIETRPAKPEELQMALNIEEASEKKSEKSATNEGAGVTPIQDMPHTELPADLTPEEQEKLEDLKADYQIESLASFEVHIAETANDEHVVSLCGQTASHKTLKGAVLYLFQKLGYPCQTPEALKEELMKFPDSEKRELILSFLATESPEKRSRRKKSE